MTDAPDPLLKLRHLTAALDDTNQIAEQLFESSPDAAVIVNNEGLIILTNRQMEFLCGYHRSELRDKPVEMLLPDALRELHKGHRAGFFRDLRSRPMGTLGLKLRLLHKAGAEIEVTINLAPIVTTYGIYVIANIRRKQAVVDGEG